MSIKHSEQHATAAAKVGSTPGGRKFGLAVCAVAAVEAAIFFGNDGGLSGIVNAAETLADAVNVGVALKDVATAPSVPGVAGLGLGVSVADLLTGVWPGGDLNTIRVLNKNTDPPDEGVYVFPDKKAGGRQYVGQSAWW
jgi:hypothetical protein